MIEFHTNNYDEGGPIYKFEYGDPDTMVQALEDYLGKPIDMWENHTATGSYPEMGDLGEETDDVRGERFHRAVANKEIALPRGDFRQADTYWSEVEDSASKYN